MNAHVRLIMLANLSLVKYIVVICICEFLVWSLLLGSRFAIAAFVGAAPFLVALALYYYARSVILIWRAQRSIALVIALSSAIEKGMDSVKFGTAVAVRDDNLFLTALHIFDGASKVQISQTGNKGLYDVEVVGSSSELNLCALRITNRKRKESFWLPIAEKAPFLPDVFVMGYEADPRSQKLLTISPGRYAGEFEIDDTDAIQNTGTLIAGSVFRISGAKKTMLGGPVLKRYNGHIASFITQDYNRSDRVMAIDAPSLREFIASIPRQ